MRLQGVAASPWEAARVIVVENEVTSLVARARNVVLPRRTDSEAALYRDLVEGRYGQNVRLEQERIRFGAVRAAVAG